MASGTKNMTDLTPSCIAEGEADEDSLFSSSGLETFGSGSQANNPEHMGDRDQHKQAAKQSRWSPVTQWTKEL